MKTIIAAIVLCFLLIGGGIYLALRPSKPQPRQLALSPAYVQHQKDGFLERGAAKPKVVVTEYGDFQCPACYKFEPTLAAAMLQTADIAQLQFKQYPISKLHDKAQLGALASEAAGRQGKFWEMHDLLYKEQPTWEPDTVVSFRDRLSGYAKSLNLNADQFNADLDDSTTADLIAADIAQGDADKLQGTPDILINGKPTEAIPQSIDALVALIRQAAQ